MLRDQVKLLDVRVFFFFHFVNGLDGHFVSILGWGEI